MIPLSEELWAPSFGFVPDFFSEQKISLCVLCVFFSIAHWFSLLPIAPQTCSTQWKTCIVVLEPFSWCCGMWVDQMYHENKLSCSSSQQSNKTIHTVREAKFHSLTSVAFGCSCFTLWLSPANLFNLINKIIIINSPVKIPVIWKRHRDHYREQSQASLPRSQILYLRCK